MKFRKSVSCPQQLICFHDSPPSFPFKLRIREKHSTLHAIINIVNVVQNNMDQKRLTCGIFLDLKKAFDTVDLDLASKT